MNLNNARIYKGLQWQIPLLQESLMFAQLLGTVRRPKTTAAVVFLSLVTVVGAWYVAPPPPRITKRPEILSVFWDKDGELRNSTNYHGLSARYVLEFSEKPTEDHIKGCYPIVTELAKRSCYVVSSQKVIVEHYQLGYKTNVIVYAVKFTDGMPRSGKMGLTGGLSNQASWVTFEDGDCYPNREKD